MIKHLNYSNSVATLALVFALGGGSAYAATTITSKDIKNGTIQTKDISKTAQSALKGKTGAKGATGAQGAAGAKGDTGAKGDQGAKGDTGEKGAPGSDVFAAAAPAGSKLFGVLVADQKATAGGDSFRVSASYPVLLGTAPTMRINPGADAASVVDSREDTTNCGGTAAAPVVASGYSCFYVTDATNVQANSIFNYSGSLTTAEDTGDRAGFYVYGSAAAAGSAQVRGVWAVNAG